MTTAQIEAVFRQRGFFHIKPGLKRMQALCAALGHPERRFASIHIAGTNGKGSVAATLESALRQAGYRTGLYTSPHLVDFSERIRVNGSAIGKKAIAQYGAKVLAAERRANIRSTYFEMTTALMFAYFADQKVETAVLECGLGGRWDATNVIPRPALAIGTSVGLDHTEWLGSTVRRIAVEKSGIIKEDGYVVSGLEGVAATVWRKRASAKRAALWQLGKDFWTSPVKTDWARWRQTWRYHDAESMVTLHSSLMGDHQIRNGALAVAALKALQAKAWSIPHTAIASGLDKVQWPGRLQRVHFAGRTFLIDGAHNPHATARLAAVLKEPALNLRPKVMVFSAFADKDFETMASHLAPHVKRVYVVAMNEERAARMVDLKTAWNRHGATVIECGGSVRRALQQVIQDTTRQEWILVAGSLRFAGDVLKEIA